MCGTLEATPCNERSNRRRGAAEVVSDPSPMPQRDPRQRDPGRGLYGISVAADLVGMGVQTLRLYEQRGLLLPQRTPAGTRRYSDNDLDRLRRIGELLTAGLNLAGIAHVLELEAELARLREELGAYESALTPPAGPSRPPTRRPRRRQR